MVKKPTVFITCHPTAGGSGIIATELAANLAANGTNTHLFSYGEPFRFSSLEDSNVTVHKPKDLNYPLFKEHHPYAMTLVQSLLSAAEKSPPDILHAHYAFPFALVNHLVQKILLRRNIPTRNIVTLHGSDTNLLGTDPAYGQIIKDSLEMSDSITAVSESLALESYATFDLDKKIKVINNFVDTERFTPNRKPHPAIAAAKSRGEKVVLHISNFRKAKNPQLVIKTFTEIAALTPSKLILAGSGPELEKCIDLAKKTGIKNHVETLGEIKNIETVYPHADVLLNLSTIESFGLTILESLSCGVPVVATKVGGVQEVLGQKGDFFKTTSSKNPKEIARLALSIIGKGRFQARQRAKFFSKEKIIKNYLDLYEKALAKN
ncbi:N-acetyl-alpha-D-glucosaminyl L-malate synthase BshA [bacterium]|nr:N-acetyl-alpha-D-glucosaminyl L-malate synthase BshA [bacterium]